MGDRSAHYKQPPDTHTLRTMAVLNYSTPLHMAEVLWN